MTPPILPAMSGATPFRSRGNASLFPMDPIHLPGPLSPSSFLLVALQSNESASSATTSHGKVAKSGLAKGSLHNPSP